MEDAQSRAEAGEVEESTAASKDESSDKWTTEEDSADFSRDDIAAALKVIEEMEKAEDLEETEGQAPETSADSEPPQPR